MEVGISSRRLQFSLMKIILIVVLTPPFFISLVAFVNLLLFWPILIKLVSGKHFWISTHCRIFLDLWWKYMCKVIRDCFGLECRLTEFSSHNGKLSTWVAVYSFYFSCDAPHQKLSYRISLTIYPCFYKSSHSWWSTYDTNNS